jgi:hypothetical protein
MNEFSLQQSTLMAIVEIYDNTIETNRDELRLLDVNFHCGPDKNLNHESIFSDAIEAVPIALYFNIRDFLEALGICCCSDCVAGRVQKRFSKGV